MEGTRFDSAFCAHLQRLSTVQHVRRISLHQPGRLYFIPTSQVDSRRIPEIETA